MGGGGGGSGGSGNGVLLRYECVKVYLGLLLQL